MTHWVVTSRRLSDCDVKSKSINTSDQLFFPSYETRNPRHLPPSPLCGPVQADTRRLISLSPRTLACPFLVDNTILPTIHMFRPFSVAVVAVVVMLLQTPLSVHQRGVAAAFSTVHRNIGGVPSSYSSGASRVRVNTLQTKDRFKQTSAGTTPWKSLHRQHVSLMGTSATKTTATSSAEVAKIIPRVKAADATEPTDGNPVLIKGWVRTVRKQKTLAFVEVNDGSNLGGIQCVLSFDAIDEGTKEGACDVSTAFPPMRNRRGRLPPVD